MLLFAAWEQAQKHYLGILLGECTDLDAWMAACARALAAERAAWARYQARLGAA